MGHSREGPHWRLTARTIDVMTICGLLNREWPVTSSNPRLPDDFPTGDNRNGLRRRIRLCRGVTGATSTGPRPKPRRSLDRPASAPAELAPRRSTFAARCRDFPTGRLTVPFTNAVPTKFLFPLSQHKLRSRPERRLDRNRMEAHIAVSGGLPVFRPVHQRCQSWA